MFARRLGCSGGKGGLLRELADLVVDLCEFVLIIGGDVVWWLVEKVFAAGRWLLAAVYRDDLMGQRWFKEHFDAWYFGYRTERKS